MSDLSVNSILDVSGGATTTINGYTPTVSNMAGRNRIINGDMRIDQRNAGAAVTQTTSGALFSLDRWQIYGSVTSKFTVQQNAASVTPPVGFVGYLGATSASAYGVVDSSQYLLAQSVEGFNVGDLGWGSANAKTITISFWVRSSLTGSFGGALRNATYTRSYPFSFTISSANTWEQKTVTVAGDTTGTWETTNAAGSRLNFSMGAGATYSGTAGAWATGNFTQPTGSVSVIGTLGATFYITGVQLEAGSVATPFEHRQYGQELALCQRYLPAYNSTSTASYLGLVAAQTTTSVFCNFAYPVTPRVVPTGLTVSSPGHFQVVVGAGGPVPSVITFNQASLNAAMFNAAVTSVTAGQAGIIYGISTAGQILFTGCEL